MSKWLPDVTLFNELEPRNFTHDLEVLKEYEQDHWRHDRISSALYMSMLDSLDFIFKNSDKTPEPIFFQVAGDDKVVSRPATENYFKSLALQNKKLKIYDGYYHEIYNEVGRDEPFTDLTNWISSLI
jgi:alpha-beta hydrolase superfamily lysophospholipase